MPQRLQRTIARPARVSGVGFFTGADVTLSFLPAGPNHGVAFQRIDRPGSPAIPASLEFVVPRERRTSLEQNGVVVEMVEHVLAALAGLRIDNCLVQLDSAEPPGCDGSALCFADALLRAGIAEQNAVRRVLTIQSDVQAGTPDGGCRISATPAEGDVLRIGYRLDYGPESPIPRQELTVEITPATFLADLAFARTFVLQSEVDSLRQQGYGLRTTARDLLVFGPDGVVDNQLRTADECARHKILDCLGDFALLGCDLCGCFQAERSGHRLNREIIRQLELAHGDVQRSANRRAA